VNYFIGKSQAWLEAELAKAQAEYAEGKSLVQASGGDASASKQLSHEPRATHSANFEGSLFAGPCDISGG
jgi:hypothetical protein